MCKWPLLKGQFVKNALSTLFWIGVAISFTLVWSAAVSLLERVFS